MAEWVDACAADDIEEEDLVRFDHDGQSYGIYYRPDGDFFCTGWLCTHEQVHLADRLVVNYEIARPSTTRPSTVAPARPCGWRPAST